jgi:hypothetical protein
MGIPHWKVSVLYVVMQLFVSGTTVLLRPSGVVVVLAWLGAAFSLFVCMGAHLRRWEFAPGSSKLVRKVGILKLETLPSRTS